MFNLLLSIPGGAVLLTVGIVVALSIFIYRVHPRTPDATVGFSPNIIQAPIIFIPMLVLFAVGFAATLMILRHRQRLAQGNLPYSKLSPCRKSPPPSSK